MDFAPHIEGNVPIRSSAERFINALRQRVADGLLGGGRSARADYRLLESDAATVKVRAGNWLTAINVGLNDVDLQLGRAGSVGYEVHYWRWASYVLGLSAAIGVLLIASLLIFYVLETRDFLIACAIALFWGFVWPWLLIAIHKRPLRRLVARLIAEVDAAASS